MILGITSLGQGRRRPSMQRLGMALLHAAGGVSGAVLLMAALWLLVTPLRTLFPHVVQLSVAAATGLVAINKDTRRPTLLLWGSQVPPEWMRQFGPLRAYFAYGAMLGAGLLTVTKYGATIVLFCGSALILPLPVALAAAVAFGVGRTVPVGPASLAATRVSRIFFRSAGAQRTLPLMSALASAAFLISTTWEASP